ncbi:FecR family protein [Chitinophaga solisilvae]|uniref:FecR family protein n=1 Tax=Chitinophaga solisilvae TaxID=1233460 RepID=UPI00136F7125|nr:FecR domain-containing protein [Chitinophaga solisilvae]
MGETENLLYNFIDNRCTEEELQQVKILLDTEAGRTMLDELLHRREAAAWNNPPAHNVAMQEVIRRKQAEMQQRIQDNENREQPPVGRIINLGKIFRYAAVWVGLILLSGLTIRELRKQRVTDTTIRYIEKVNPKGAPERYLLPDSTVVYLAAGSRLKYPDTYPQTGRDIELQGEAFFDVSRDEVHPFTIRSGMILTRVLGTSFRITAWEGQQQEVAVATGKVSISTVAAAKITELGMLTPGRKITYDPETGKAVPGAADISSIEQWKAGGLLFTEMPMHNVAIALERRYGIAFHFDNAGAARHVVSGSFSAADSLPAIVDMLAFVGKFSYRLSADGKTYFIK